MEAAKAAVSDCKAAVPKDADYELQAEAIGVDVTQEDSVKTATTFASQALGRIDYCVNGAGVRSCPFLVPVLVPLLLYPPPPRTVNSSQDLPGAGLVLADDAPLPPTQIGVRMASEIADADVEEFKNMLDVNVTGTFLVTRAVSAAMKLQEAQPTGGPGRGTSRGTIVNIGSASSFVATPGMVQYTAAKHAVVGITKNAALDNAKNAVRVNSVCPSWVDTPMIRKAMEHVEGLGHMIESSVPLGRIALADEVADAVVFLSSPLSSYMTGCNMILDGGTTLTSHA